MTETVISRRRGAFSMTTMIMLVLVGAFSFSALITLMTFAPDLREPDGRAHALSRSAIGFAAAIELARARGHTVNISRNADMSTRARLLVVTPNLGGIDQDSLLRIAAQRTLVILPKWSGRPHDTQKGWITDVNLLPDELIEIGLGELVDEPDIAQVEGTSHPRLRFDGRRGLDVDATPFRSGEIASLQTLSGKNVEPVLTTEDGRIVVGYIGNTELYDTYILSDPDFLNTHGLSNLETARAGIRILEGLHFAGDPIVFDVTLNGYARARDPFRLALEPPLLGATLSLVIAAVLLGWRAAAHQTPEVAGKRAIALGKRALVENSAALVRLARREHAMGGRYAELIAAVTADQIGIAKKGVENVPLLLDRIGARSGVSESFSVLAAQAAASQTPAELVSAARKLHSWNEEVVRATR